MQVQDDSFNKLLQCIFIIKQNFTQNTNFHLGKMLEFKLLNLHLKIENQDKFCCDDGLCIDSKYACDMSIQCQGLKTKVYNIV